MSHRIHDWSQVRFVLCDLDGVVWLAHHPIGNSPDAIARLRASGRRVLFVTNNSFSLVADQEAALEAIGIPASGDVVTSAQAGALLVSPGERALVCGGPGVTEALAARGIESVTPEQYRDESATAGTGAVDVVVVGFHRNFDYERMRIATLAVQRGARLVATNDDATYPTPAGPIPGGGAIVASIAYATSVAAVVAGKPQEPMAELVRTRCGPDFSDATALMVGDRWSTDGLFAVTLGCPFALVRSGVTPIGSDPGGTPALDLADLSQVADAILGA